jgi:hypothetical protein
MAIEVIFIKQQGVEEAEPEAWNSGAKTNLAPDFL